MVLLAISGLGFGTWFALSVVKQFRAIPARTFWLENFTFIPRWWFFRYNFAEGEFRISVRAAHTALNGDAPNGDAPNGDGPNGDGPEWEVVDLPRAPLWRQAFWNPEMRTNKMLWDACTRLCALPTWLRFSRNFTPSTVAYKVLVAWLESTPAVAGRFRGPIQMKIERAPLTPGAGGPVAWFVSRPFLLAPADASVSDVAPARR